MLGHLWLPIPSTFKWRYCIALLLKRVEWHPCNANCTPEWRYATSPYCGSYVCMRARSSEVTSANCKTHTHRHTPPLCLIPCHEQALEFITTPGNVASASMTGPFLKASPMFCIDDGHMGTWSMPRRQSSCKFVCKQVSVALERMYFVALFLDNRKANVSQNWSFKILGVLLPDNLIKGDMASWKVTHQEWSAQWSTHLLCI